MHLIFKQAKTTIGVLAHEIQEGPGLHAIQEVAEVGQKLEKALEDEKMQSADLARLTNTLDVAALDAISDVLASVMTDPWFSRTWVLQERGMAENQLHILLVWSGGREDMDMNGRVTLIVR